jgi:hypothetical protein
MQISSSIQEKIIIFGANNHIMHTDNTGQIAGVDTDGNQQPEGTTKHQITPAKRQKMETESESSNNTMQMDYQRVGHAQQASLGP